MTLNGEGARTTCYLAFGSNRRLKLRSASQPLRRSGNRTLTWKLPPLSTGTTY